MVPADWFIVLGILVIAVVDVLFIVYKTPTISRRLRGIGYRVSFFPYAWGALGGHFWGPSMDPAFGSWWISVGLLIACGALVSGIHHAMLRWASPPDWTALLYLPCGIPAGIFFWPQ